MIAYRYHVHGEGCQTRAEAMLIARAYASKQGVKVEVHDSQARRGCACVWWVDGEGQVTGIRRKGKKS